MSVTRESFEAAVAFANDRAEGGRQLDIVRAEVEWEALGEQHTSNLLALAALVDGDERAALLEQVRTDLNVTVPEPDSAESAAHTGPSDPPTGLQPAPDPATPAEPVQPADEGGPVDDHGKSEPMHV